MSVDLAKEREKPKPDISDLDIDWSKLEFEKKEDLVQRISKNFEKGLREILGDKYIEDPSQVEPARGNE